MGKLRLDAQMQAVHIVHHGIPCVALTEIDRNTTLGQGKTVPQMVMAEYGNALFVQKARKTVIACYVFCDAVGDLQNGCGLTAFRQPGDAMQPGLAVGGEKGKVRHICHGNSVLSVL